MCRVLIIEDEWLIADYLADIAESAGATSIVFANNEEDALELARSAVPDVIFSDVDLKEGGSGPMACAAIRAEHGPIPVIFITGTPELCSPCDYAAAIFDKPIRPQRLIAAFQMIAP